jgi:iron complex transport system substrate-binding protein
VNIFLNIKITTLLLAAFIATAFTISCTSVDKKNSDENRDSSNKIITRARRLSIEKTDSCTILTITNPWQGAKGINQIYYLVNKNSRLIHITDTSGLINVPVEKIICMSTTHVAMVAALGKSDAIKGISGADYIFNEDISGKIRKGLVYDVGYETGINNELILKLSPDLIMMYGIGSESAAYLGKIKELGIKVMFNADYLENDPLGKAEWIKLFGALLCREDKADSIFKAICESYDLIKTYISQNCNEKPNVLLGLPFRDTWFISPGNSYINNFIEDAGGNYLWHGTVSDVSMPYSLEDVFLKSLKADFWLNTGSATSKNEISSIDPRLGKLPCFISGAIYNNNKRISSKGGNDYWESGVLNPHLILKDIAAILHPELFPEAELYYYRKIE